VESPTRRHVAPFTTVAPAKNLAHALATTAVTCACGGEVTLNPNSLTLNVKLRTLYLQPYILHPTP
jgi:hypothetical protein